MDDPVLANDKYRATLRSTYIDGVDTTLNVTAIPPNLPTIVIVGWNTQYETKFKITGTSGTNSSNYALTGLTKISGYEGNIPENSAVNCLNSEDFFNQYGERMTILQDNVDEAVEDVETIAAGLAPTPFNLLNNGNFINNSLNGYGSTPDDWTNSSANPVQGGVPTLTKQQVIDMLGVADGEIEALYNLNGNFTDLSANGYNLTASGSPTDDNDGLMAQVKKFASASSQYATGAAANVKVTGSQTFVVFVNPTTIGTQQWLMGIAESGGSNIRGFQINTSGKIVFHQDGLTTNTFVTSDVVLEAGKWYMIVGVYDSASSKLKLWINGIKKEVTASGSVNAGTSNNLSIGRLGDFTTNTANAKEQNVMILSVALSDDQVKQLWAHTNYSKLKIRRATSDGFVYQDLPASLVEQYRGKTLSLVGEIYQGVASTVQLSIDDGTEGESDAFATVDAWTQTTVSKVISATARSIRIKVKISDSDGNAWVRFMRLLEGTAIAAFDHSKNDIARFGSLVEMIPTNNGNGYVNLTRRVLHYLRKPLSSAYNNAASTAEQEVTGLRVTLPIIPRKCLVKVYWNAYLTTPAANNTMRIRAGSNTTYLSNSEVGNVYVGAAKTIETFLTVAEVELDLSTENYVVISVQADASPSGLSLSASGFRTSVIVEIYG